jgi:hypothetical protein
MSKRRKGFPSETKVKGGVRVVHCNRFEVSVWQSGLTSSTLMAGLPVVTGDCG